MSSPSETTHDQLANHAAEAAGLMQALSNQTRLRLMCLLIDGEKSTGELAKALHMQMPAISQHLSKMRAKNLVTSRRDGQTIYYRANTGIGPAIVGTLCEWYKKV